jgi:hypothetical protein
VRGGLKSQLGVPQRIRKLEEAVEGQIIKSKSCLKQIKRKIKNVEKSLIAVKLKKLEKLIYKVTYLNMQ